MTGLTQSDAKALPLIQVSLGPGGAQNLSRAHFLYELCAEITTMLQTDPMVFLAPSGQTFTAQ